ncbi:polysaccharide deacetylase family protein [Pontibacter litorisediminis]|uniref:polysaccharide deacetylase family protein n=1 Tax=Pontibacter litorisediminis TaxID=1846260 RepID=UPI0023EC0F52|nr:polysaccharide deacetylase family protein [Pontibacter litorisediminis]
MNVSFRNVFGWFVACLLIMFGFVGRAVRRAKRGECLLSIYFHKPSRSEFETCIKWLKKKGFIFISTRDIEKIIQQELPFPMGAVLITVDDGWQTNEANIVEIANKHQVPVTIFVSTSPVEEGTYWWSYMLEAKRNRLKSPHIEAMKRVPDHERLTQVAKLKRKLTLEREAMTVDQVRKMADSEYITVGGHSHTHPILTNCTDEQVYFELQCSKRILEGWIGKQVPFFAYPNGDYGLREVQTLQKLDYKLAFSCEPVPLTPASLGKTYELPRLGFLEGASFEENLCRIVGVWHPIMSRLKFPFYRKHSYKRADALSANCAASTVLCES